MSGDQGPETPRCAYGDPHPATLRWVWTQHDLSRERTTLTCDEHAHHVRAQRPADPHGGAQRSGRKPVRVERIEVTR